MLAAQALSVSELTTHVKRVLERDEVLVDVSVRGEISNFTRHSSGHLYFSLKDDSATLSCVCFRGAASKLRFDAADGMCVIAEGGVTVYEKAGRYQLLVRTMRPDGQGDLALAYEQLKQKLESEGLFAPERKRALPRFPRGVALITSPTGAAIRDLLNILSRRFPPARVYVIPTIVQGEAAAASIISSLQYANTLGFVDVIILGRGGGSLEDLWCFNEEAVARAVFASRLPVVSAVGHETDFCLCDFVADLRAPTPSAAAELVVPDRIELQRHLEATGRHLRVRLEGLLAQARGRYSTIAAHPLLQRPQALVEAREQRLDEALASLQAAMQYTLERRRARLERALVGLEALSPHAVLGRGYAICRDRETGRVIRRVDEVAPEQALHITVSDGDIAATAD